MLIKAKNIKTNDNGIARLESYFDGDKFYFKHAQKVDDILESTYLDREHGDNCFSKDREFQKIASIPMLEFIRRPELLHDETGKSLIRWLKSDEGGLYRTTKGGI